MIHNLSDSNSLVQHFVAEMRDVGVQEDRLRFRRNLERIGEVLAYEISKSMNYKDQEVTTPLGTTTHQLLADQPVLATVLRAGLPLHMGMLNYFDKAGNAIISAYREYNNDGSFEVRVEYMASPPLDGKVLILNDPMLATGRSMVQTYELLLEKGTPSQVYVAGVIGSTQGVDYVMEHMPEGTELWIGAIDQELDEHSYIVPGLGDAGDLAFGMKT